MTTSWKGIAAFATAAASCVVAPRPATAQDTGIVPIRVKVGVLLPSDSDTKDATGSTHLNGEVDLSLPNFGAGKYIFTAGYAQGSRDGNKLRVIPITVARVFGPPNPLRGVTGNVYFGVGAGAYLLKASAVGQSESKTTFGGFGMIGYQFPNPYFIEAKYHVAGSVNSISPNGVAILVGRHF